MKWHGNDNEVMCKGQFKAVCPICGCESKSFNEIHDFINYVADNWVAYYIEKLDDYAFVCSECSKKL